MSAAGHSNRLANRDTETNSLARRLGRRGIHEPVVPTLDKNRSESRNGSELLDFHHAHWPPIVAFRSPVTQRDKVGAKAIFFGLGVKANKILRLQCAQYP